MRTPGLPRPRSGLIVLGGTIAAALALSAAGLLGGCAADGTPTPAVTQFLKASCPWDQALQPAGVAIVGGLGPVGATAAAIDKLALHPAVVGLCNGGPVALTPATAADVAKAVTIDLTGAKPGP